MKPHRLAPGVLAAVTVAVGCFHKPNVDGDKLLCMVDDDCLPGYVCPKKPNDTTQNFVLCVRSGAPGIDGSAPEVASLDTSNGETAAATDGHPGIDNASAIDGPLGLLDSGSGVDSSADTPFALVSDALADTVPTSPIDSASDRTVNPAPDGLAAIVDGASPDLPLPDGPTTDAPIGGTGGAPGTGGAAGSGGVSGIGTGGGSGTGGVPGTGGTSAPPPIDCGPLDNPLNGSVTALTTTVGSEADYTCQTGFGPSGSSTRYCLASGLWSGVAPTCVIANCPGLPSPPNGSVSAPTLTYGSNATYTCQPGYNLAGSVTRTCQPDGTWSGAAPTCPPVDCGALTDPTNGKVTVSTTTYLSSASYTCDTGYSISGSTSRTCQADKNWSGTAPTCTLVDCGPLLSPTSGAIDMTATTYGATATYSCSNGATLSGDTVRTCQVDGNWSGSAATCQCPNGKTACAAGCVDLQTDHNNCGTCGNVCLATSPSTAQCTSTGCLVTLAGAQSYPWGIKVDTTNVYWANTGESNQGTVMKVPLGGGAITTLASGQASPAGLAIDSTSAYWGNATSLAKVSLSGGPITILASAISPGPGIVVDSASVYFSYPTIVAKVPLSGGPITTIALGQPSPYNLVADKTNLYWTDTNGYLTRATLGGSAVTRLTPRGTQCYGIAVDAMNVYWGTSGEIMKIPLAGGSTTTLASGQGKPVGIAVDATSVYWITEGSSSTADGTVMKVPISGGPATMLASGQFYPLGIDIDATSVYWTTWYGNTVMKLTPK